jgi:predicted O-methyltransferase YrrM
VNLPDLRYLTADAEQFRTGLSPHYPILWALVRGLEAENTFEFGAGDSTRVFLDAAAATGGRHHSCSMEAKGAVLGGALATRPEWAWHHHGLSSEALKRLPAELGFDLVLHDGSHSEEIVREDLIAILPRIRRHGLLCIHDTLHSGCGAGMRAGVRAALKERGLHPLTLPFGFGLTLVRVDESAQAPIRIRRSKRGSEHRTELGDFV